MKYIFTILLFCNCILVKAGYWTQKADFPDSGREVPGGFTIGSKGYIGCGNGNSGLLIDFWQYDPGTNTWARKANFGGAATCGVASFAINNKGYFACGYPGLTDLWEYDPATDAWTQKANCGTVARQFASGFSIGTKGYVCCGTESSTILNDLWEWDQPTNTWTQKSSLPGTAARTHAVSFAINTKGYVTTGEGNFGKLKDLWEYDPSSDTWTQKADLPGSGRMDAAGFSICNKGYVGTGGYPVLSDFWEYDPSINQWTQKTDLPLPARDDCPGIAIGTKGYIGLGDIGSYVTDFWEYTPDSIVCSASVAPVAGFQSGDTVICANGCIALTNSSSNATSYQWFFSGANPSSSTEANPQTVCYLSSGVYSVTLVATGPGGSDSLTFSNYIDVKAAPQDPVITQADSVLYCSTNPLYVSYQWYDSTTLIPGATDTFLVINHSGDYNVQVSNADSCKIAVGINVVLSDKDISNESRITIFPNPASDKLTVQFSVFHDEQVIDISIMNITGQMMEEKKIKWRGSTIINTALLSPGIYILKLQWQNLYILKKFAKE